MAFGATIVTSRATVSLIVLLVAGFSLAGCVGGEDAGPSGGGATGPAAFDETTGAVEGQVVDEESLPVGGAEVAFIQSEVSAQARADDSGRFALSNVPPGSYLLAAQRLGYSPEAKRVEVSAGQVTPVTITLSKLAVDEPWVEMLNHNGQYGTGAAIVRTTLCSGCSSGDRAWFFFGGFPEDMQGMMVEARWETSDYFGFDLNTRTSECGEDNETSCMWYRSRGQSPLRFFVEPCGDYRGEPTYGRSPMPCHERLSDFQASSGDDAPRLETWYLGQFQDEAHALDPVCKTAIPGVLPGYEAGCYGAGVAPETRWTTWVSLFHQELPEDYEQHTAFPDA